ARQFGYGSRDERYTSCITPGNAWLCDACVCFISGIPQSESTVMRPIRSEPRVLNNVTESGAWRHSWHFSPYLSAEIPVGSLCGPAFSWESQLFSG
ncbi:hypothetical protein L9F63_002482, partial [Diploptera punctata]